MKRQWKKAGDEVRPIGARALKSAIDSIRPYLPESRVLDIFAGQGRFGIEALHEGAASVTFVEKSNFVARELETILTKTPHKNFDLTVDDAFSFLRRTERANKNFDIVFADTPFEWWTANFSETLMESVIRVLAPSGIFLVKHPKRVIPFLPSDGENAVKKTNALQLWKRSPFGESTLLYLRLEQRDPSQPE